MARENRIYSLILAILAICYSAQVFTPLRLHPDAIVLLSMADSAAHQGGFLFHGRTTVFPPGYPALLALLLRMSIAHTWVIVAINIGFLFLGLFAVCRVLPLTFFRERNTILGVCVLSLLSFVFIRFFTVPLSDVPFFGLAMCSVAGMEYMMRLEIGNRYWLCLLGTCVLLLVSIAVRSAGLALIPAFLWMVFSQSAVKAYLKSTAGRVAVSAIGILACGVILARTSIVADLNLWLRDFELAMRSHTLVDAASIVLGFRLQELGEITANVPFVVVPESARRVIPWMAALLLTCLMWGLFLQRKMIGPTQVFVISYVCLLVAWPYYDPRFWLPLIPLLISYGALTARRLLALYPRLPFSLLAAYLGLYAVIGLNWLAASTTITFSRSAFLTRYVAEKEYRPAYCVVLGPCEEGFATGVVDQGIVHLLRLYQ